MTATDTRSARPFGAVGTAMVSPMTEGGDLDLDAAGALGEHLVRHGNDLLVVAGTTGESPTLSDEEKLSLNRVVREAVGPDVTIVAGVGSYDTAHSIALARAHADLGILDGLLVVTPYYSKPAQAGIVAHTVAVADATDLPVMLYDIPGRTGVGLSTDTLLRLAEHDRILAVKDAKADFAQAAAVMEATGLAYYSGEDALNLPWMTVGAAGIVSVVGQVAGDLERELVTAVDAGDLAGARSAHQRLAPLVEAIMTRLPGAVAAKAALHLQGVLPSAALRLPHVPADDAQLRELELALGTAVGITPLDPSRRTL